MWDVQRFEDLAETPALLFPDRPPVSYADLARRMRDASLRYGDGRKLVALEMHLSEHAIVYYLAALAGGIPGLAQSETSSVAP